MHDAFEAAPILEKLPLQIESIACYSKFANFLVIWKLLINYGVLVLYGEVTDDARDLLQVAVGISSSKIFVQSQIIWNIFNAKHVDLYFMNG